MACPAELNEDHADMDPSFLIRTQSWSPWEMAIILDTQCVPSISVSIMVQ